MKQRTETEKTIKDKQKNKTGTRDRNKTRDGRRKHAEDRTDKGEINRILSGIAG